MDLAINSNLTLWNECSNTIKNIFNTSNFHQLDAKNVLAKEALIETLNSIFVLKNREKTAHFLFITSDSSTAIDLYLLIKEMNKEISCCYVLPHQDMKCADIVICPFYTITLDKNETYEWSMFDYIFYNNELSQNSGIHKLYGTLNQKTLLIPNQFDDIIREKIDDDNPIIPIESPHSKRKIDTLEDNPSEYIALVSKIHKRRYIRDYIRHQDQNRIIIIANTRQNARQLDNYLYRAKIKSKIIHDNASEDAQLIIVNQLNNEAIQAIILTHKTVKILDSHFTQINTVIFLDLPNAYVEFDMHIDYVKNHLHPNRSISIATRDEIPWIRSMKQECKSVLPVIEINSQSPASKPEIKIRRNRHNRGQQTKKISLKSGQPKQSPFNQEVVISIKPSAPTKALAPIKEQKSQHFQNQPVKPRIKNNQNSNHKPSDQQKIVNQNRSPFEEGSFEANIAKVNKRRVRNVFSNQRQNKNISFQQENLPNVSPKLRSNTNSRRKNSPREDNGNGNK